MQPTEAQKQAWQNSRPRKSLAAKAIITSVSGNILLVKPHHKDAWQFPGGALEAHEEPVAALVRELCEELAMNTEASDFVITSTVFREQLDVLLLIYRYTKTVPEDTPITLQPEELSAYKFVPPQEVHAYVSDYYTPFCESYLR